VGVGIETLNHNFEPFSAYHESQQRTPLPHRGGPPDQAEPPLQGVKFNGLDWLLRDKEQGHNSHEVSMGLARDVICEPYRGWSWHSGSLAAVEVKQENTGTGSRVGKGQANSDSE
jgi:hypothetical protein